MNKTELAGKIKLLEGLTEDEKSALLGLLHEQKKYGLVWEDKPEDVEQKMEDELPILKEVKERAIISDDPSAPNHILIEGDNLHALTALTYTHQGKIDVIYIDPPYNTGNNDFIYNDRFVDKLDGYRHSKWLSFISKRLKIAQGLLSNNGVIFISIDENEIGQLKILCDELFFEKNCLGVLVWDLGSGTSAGHFTRSHEYILVYCKSKELLPNFSGGDGIIDDRAIKKESAKNKKFLYSFKAGTKFEAAEGTEFSGTWGSSEKTELIEGRFLCKNGKLAEDITLAACWTQKNQMDSFFNGKETYDTKGQKVIEFYFRDNGKLYYRKEKGTINPPSVLRGIATTKQGSSILKEMFDGKELFSFAKPVELIKFIERLFSSNAIILDFFAGSGTTLHATMQLNAEEEGHHHQCILITNNENNICEEVTYMRSKKVIQGYKTPKGKEVEGLKNNTLRYYRTDFVPREQTNKNKRALMAAATDLLCIKNDVYTEQNTFGGRKLKPNAARYFDNGKTQMLLIYNELAVEAFASMLKEMEVEGKIKIYVFSNNRYAYNDNFENVLDKVELCALPAAIYDAYKKVLKPQKVKENVSQESISEEYVFEKTKGEIDFSEEGGEQ